MKCEIIGPTKVKRITVGPVLFNAYATKFEVKELVFVKTNYGKFKGIITYIDAPYQGIIITDTDNSSISHRIDLCDIEDIYHVVS